MATNPAIAVDDAEVEVIATADDQTAFDFDFPIYEAEQIEVQLNGVAVAASNYVVTGLEVASGGTVTFNTAWAVANIEEDDLVTIRRLTPIRNDSGQVRFSQQADFRAYTINRALDTLTMIDQEARRDIDDNSADITAEAATRAGADVAHSTRLSALEVGGSFTFAAVLFSTAALIASMPVSPAFDVIQVAGAALIGDDHGGEPITLERDDSELLPGFIEDSTGAHFAFKGVRIPFSQMLHGATVAGGDNSVALAAALDHCASIAATTSANGVELLIDTPGDYVFTSGLAEKTCAYNLTITFGPGARFKCAAGMDVPLLHIKGAAGTTRADFRVVVNNPRIDMSAGDSSTPGGGTQPSAISVRNYRDVFINEPDIYGGEAWSDGAGTSLTTGMDSGIEVLNVGNFVCSGGSIKGATDVGIYWGGSNTLGDVDDGFLYMVNGTLIEHCETGISGKRDGRQGLVQSCTIRYCNMGVNGVEVAAPQDPSTPAHLEIFDCLIEYCASPIFVNAQTNLKVKGNTIRDWGYDEDLSAAIANPFGVRLQGISKATITGNTFEIRALADTAAHVGIWTVDYTDADGVPWAAGFNHGIGNNFIGVAHPIAEGASTDASAYVGNITDTVPVFVNGGSGTIFEYRIPNDATLYTVSFPTDHTPVTTWTPGKTFRAHKNATDQTWSGTGATTITFGTESWDRGAEFGASAFTPALSSRKRRLHAQLRMSAATAGEQFLLEVLAISTPISARYFVFPAAGQITIDLDALIEPDGASAYTVRLTGDNAGSKTVEGAAAHTFFEASEA